MGGRTLLGIITHARTSLEVVVRRLAILATFAAFVSVLSVIAVAQQRGQTPPKTAPPAAQHAAGRPVGHGYIPPHGPAPTPKTTARAGQSAPARGTAQAQARPLNDMPQHPNAPHVHPDNGAWIGHESSANDVHFHLDQPWAHGHFSLGIGASFVYRIEGGDANRFWFEGSAFQVSPYDATYAADWNWQSDDVVIYDDPDHVGWYLGYNPRTGVYVHVLYLGPR
jgi:hypothetical protein